MYPSVVLQEAEGGNVTQSWREEFVVYEEGLPANIYFKSQNIYLAEMI